MPWGDRIAENQRDKNMDCEIEMLIQHVSKLQRFQTRFSCKIIEGRHTFWRIS